MRRKYISIACLMLAALLLLSGCAVSPESPATTEEPIETPEPKLAITSRDVGLFASDTGIVDREGEEISGYVLDEESNIRTDYGKLIVAAENAEAFTVIQELCIGNEESLHPRAAAYFTAGGELAIEPFSFYMELSLDGEEVVNQTLTIESPDPAALSFPYAANLRIISGDLEIPEDGVLPSLNVKLDENRTAVIAIEGMCEGRHLILARNLYGAAFQVIEVEIVPEFYIAPQPQTTQSTGEEEEEGEEVHTAHEHHFEASVVSPTPSSQGYTEHVCHECGYCYRDNYTLKTECDHQYEPALVPPTYTTQGYTLFVCKLCGDVYRARETEPILCDHSKTKATVVKPTCTEKGYTIHDCLICRNYSYTDNEKPPLGHLWDNGRTIKFATCVDEGEKLFTCRRCKETKIEPIEATGKHKYKAVVTKATCTTDGSTVYTCTVCGDSYVGKVVPAYGHTTQLDWYTTTKPTCGTDGEKSGYCRRCMEIVATEIIPATGRHQWSAVVVEPTETEPGYTEHTCQVCGQSYRDSETPPTGEN